LQDFYFVSTCQSPGFVHVCFVQWTYANITFPGCRKDTKPLGARKSEDHEVDEAKLDQIADLTIDVDGHEPIPAQRDLYKGSTKMPKSRTRRYLQSMFRYGHIKSLV
jgi:hypothetical protein